MRFLLVILIKKINVGRLPLYGGLVQLRKKSNMVTWLCPQDKSQVKPLQITNMGAIAAQAVFDNDYF